jgi:Ca2+-binding EF-hand superfamily protein
MFNRIDVENTVGADEPTDEAGYLGKSKYYREKVKIGPITEREFLEVVWRDNKIKQVMLMIKQIDRDHNGYVTASELDDIVKIVYAESLKTKDLIPIMSKFCSIQNRILIDYKKFRDWILTNVE